MINTATLIRPMLAQPFKTSKKLTPSEVFVQPKLDGVRMIWDGGCGYSRNQKPLIIPDRIVHYLTTNFSGIPLDGELYSDILTFEELISTVRGQNSVFDSSSVSYHVFDTPIPNEVFDTRHKKLLDLRYSIGIVELVETIKVPYSSDINELNIYGGELYEGTMVRFPDGLYEFGKRSKYLQKIKLFLENEFKIVGYTPLIRYDKAIVPEGTSGSKRYADGRSYKDINPKPQELVGTLVCETVSGKKFEVGSGLTQVQRKEYYHCLPTNQYATVIYQELTSDGIPRFPRFKTLRNYE